MFRQGVAVRQVGKGVYQISLAWSNAYLLTEGGEAALIDTGLAKDRGRLLEAVRQVGVAPEQIRAAYLTHAHCDHAGNAAYFAGRARKGSPTCRAAIYTHQAEAPYLGRPLRTYAPPGWQRLVRLHTSLAFLAGELLYPVERCGADVLLTEGQIVEAPGGPLRVLASPGHTPGHVAYFRERDGLLFSGDAVLNIIPVKRVTGLSLPMPLFTENWEQAKQSARRLAELRPAALLAGHGWPLTEETAVRLAEWARRLR